MEESAPSLDWVLVGKMSPPQQVVAIAQRQDLIERLRQHRDKRLIVVIAPPGFGKTTLLGQWWAESRQASGGMTAWLSLDESDADVGRFMACLLLALAQAGVALGDLGRMGAAGAREPSLDADISRTVLGLVDVVRRATSAICLILDDYHRASSAGVDDIIRRLIEAELPQLQIVLAARQRPRFQVSALKARGLVHGIDAHDLVLSQSEAAQVLGGQLSRSDLAIVHARTEGWAVAVQLARIWMEQGQGSAVGLQAFGGQMTDVADYLTEQLVAQLSPDLREFLLDTALLERFNPAMADAVRERRDSQALLTRLGDFEALLVPLDSQRTWFRYHALFADYLQLRIEPDRARQIDTLAARWLAGQRDWSSAVRHALRAGDTALAVQLVRAAGGWELVLWRGMRYAQNILDQFDDQTLRSDPALLIMQAYLHARLGHEDLAAEMLRLAEWGMGHDIGLQRDYKIINALVQTIFDRFGPLERWPASVEAVEAALPKDNIGQGTLLCCSALAHFGAGRMEATVGIARLAAVRMQFANSPLGQNFCLMHEAMALSTSGQVSQASSLIDDALALAEKNFEAQGSLKSMVTCFKAQHLYWQGDWEAASRCAAEVPHIMLHNDGWYDVYASAFEVQLRLCWREQGMAAVAPMLTQIANFGRERRLPRLVQLTQAWRVDLLAQSGQLAQARLEAHASDLAALAQAARTPAANWRLAEAAVLAMVRLHICAGTPHLARSLIEMAQDAFAQRALTLPVWRLQLLDHGAQKRVQASGEELSQLTALLSRIHAQDALGLVLEAGPGMLPWLSRIDAAGAGIAPGPWADLLGRLQGTQAGVQDARAGFNAKALEVLALLADGLPNKQMARALGVSENTVKFHLKQIFAKLSVDNRLSAVTSAQKLGLLPRQDQG
jgi:LuxR family transcriptional regulator, maltose regulon positive regulatory protein